MMWIQHGNSLGLHLFIVLIAFINGYAQEQSEPPRSPPKTAIIAEPLQLDMNSAAILARVKTDVNGKLSDNSITNLRTVFNNSSAGLIPVSDPKLPESAAYQRFVNGRWLAASLLLSVPSRESNVTPEARDQIAMELWWETPTLYQLASEATSLADKLQAIDRYIEIGWTQAARSLLYQLEPSLRFVENGPDALANLPQTWRAVSWYEAYSLDQAESVPSYTPGRFASAEEHAQNFFVQSIQRISEATKTSHWNQQTLVRLWMRLLFCSVLEKNVERFEVESRLIQESFGDLPFDIAGISPTNSTNLTESITVRQAIAKWQKFSANSRGSLSAEVGNDYPRLLGLVGKELWKYRFEDQNYAAPKAFLPGYPSTPAITPSPSASTEFQVLLRRGNEIFFRTTAGVQSVQARTAAVAAFVSPRSGSLPLAVADDASLGGITRNGTTAYCLVDSGLRSSAASDALRESVLVACDFTSGSPPTFFARATYQVLAEEDASNRNPLCLIGTPLCTGEHLYVLAVQQDARLKASFRVLCLRTSDLSLRWLSPELGWSGAIERDSVNKDTCLLFSQGRLFVATGHGTIAALDTTDGQVLFQWNYAQRSVNRFDSRYKPIVRTAIVTTHDVVIFCSNDSERLIALDWNDGHLHWSVDLANRQRSPQLVGVSGNSVICLGDRLAWIDARSGQLQNVVELPALCIPPSGHAVLYRERVLWSNGETLFSYPALRSPTAAPYMVRSMSDMDRLGYQFSEPVSFAISDELLTIVTPSAWHCYQMPSSASSPEAN